MSTLVARTGSASAGTRSKNIDYTPDITSDAYWDAHFIAVVRVSQVGKDDQGRPELTFVVTRSLTNGGMPQTRTVHLSDFWAGPDGEQEVRFGVSQEFVLYQARHAREPLVASPVDEATREQVSALLRIAGMRAEPGVTEPVMESPFDANPLVSRYGLSHLLKEPFSAPPEYRGRLLRLRDEENRPAASRVLAARLADKVEGREGSDAEYSWLKQAITRTPAAAWTDLKPFVDRIVEFERKRQETVLFLCSMVKQQRAPAPVRIAAYSVFNDPRMFHFEQPDELSDSIFQTCIELLSDPDAGMRRAGAALLHNIAGQTAAHNHSRYVEQAARAIQTALAREADTATAEQFRHYLSLLGQIGA